MVVSRLSVLVAAVTALSACNGGGSGPSAADGANRICQQYTSEMAKLGDPPAAAEAFTSTGPDGDAARKELSEYGSRVQNMYRSVILEIRALKPSSDEKELWAEWLAALNSRASAQEDRHQAVQALKGDLESDATVGEKIAEANSRIETSQRLSDELARELGASACVGVV